jgi:hypothetical protein
MFGVPNNFVEVQVKTLDGPMVWRRRHYRVRRDKTPGTFYFTVLDNGVISKEFWRIVDVTDDLSWGLFYYSGAAEAAGQSYTGAATHIFHILCVLTSSDCFKMPQGAII